MNRAAASSDSKRETGSQDKLNRSTLEFLARALKPSLHGVLLNSEDKQRHVNQAKNLEKSG